jgi:hypothetical protein
MKGTTHIQHAYSPCTAHVQVWHAICNTASNQQNNITMRTPMTILMTALQGASVLLASLDLGCGNALALICFAASTIGVWAAQALDK